MFTFWGHYQRIACRVSFRSVPPHCLSPFLRLQWYSLIADARCCLLRHLFSSCSSSLLLLSLWCPFSSTTATSVGCLCVCVCDGGLWVFACGSVEPVAFASCDFLVFWRSRAAILQVLLGNSCAPWLPLFLTRRNTKGNGEKCTNKI